MINKDKKPRDNKKRFNSNRSDRGGRTEKRFSNDRPRRERSFSDREGGKPMMYDAVCDNCGRDCKVPFKPTSGKPIFCSDCFEQVERDRDNGDFSRSSFSRPKQNTGNEDLQRQLREINQKLDKILSELNKSNMVL